MNKSLLAVVAVILLAAVGFWYWNGQQAVPPVENGQVGNEQPAPQEVSAAQVESHVRANISTLSPEPEVLGGTFYVTEITVNEQSQSGTVSYEDGHIALEATFAYRTNAQGEVEITSFVVEEQP